MRQLEVESEEIDQDSNKNINKWVSSDKEVLYPM